MTKENSKKHTKRSEKAIYSQPKVSRLGHLNTLIMGSGGPTPDGVTAEEI